VALVIGCGKYRAPGIPELSTPVNDARKMAVELARAPLGFDVVEVTDPTRNQFFEKLDEFKAHARGAKVVLVYYSGHGIEADGVNYLIPVDAVLEKPSHLESEAVPFSRILSTMESTGAEAKVAVLDSCRNNPFGHSKSWRDAGKGVSEDVLAELGDAQLPEATLVCFATSPGRRAAAVLTDDSENSPFTEFLLKRLVTPGARLRDIFESTADDVAQATKNHQLPYVKYDGAASVLRQLVLAPALAVASAAQASPPIPSTSEPTVPSSAPSAFPPAPRMETAKLETPRPAVTPVAIPRPAGTGGGVLESATKEAPFVNTLGMKFAPVPGTNVLFSVWDTRVEDYAKYAREKRIKPEKPGIEQGATHPVVDVNWDDAQAFCSWLSKKEGRTYRLPTDAEWSAAVGLGEEQGATPEEKEKNGPNDVYPWGRQWPPPTGAGNYADATAKKAQSAFGYIGGYDDGYAYTSRVGIFAANQNGLYDMGGNVWQWCEDSYNEKNEGRVLRGASWSIGDVPSLRSKSRRHVAPSIRGDDFGFRCVLVISGG